MLAYAEVRAPEPELDSADLRCSIAVGTTAFALYLATLAPTVTSEDSGELIGAAFVAGIPHPPGYPLWTLLAWVFAHLPGLETAYGVNLMSAVWAAVTVSLAHLISRSMGVPTPSAAAGALVLACSERFWSQAVIAEVYTLNTALFAATLLALLRFRAHGRRRSLLVAAGTWGLALANHYMLTLTVAPAFVWLVFQRWRTVLRDRQLLFRCGVLVLAGLSLYLYLPLAASACPRVNWGDPSTPERFWLHVTRAAYRDLELGTQVTLGEKLSFLAHFGRLGLAQFTPGLLIVAVLGTVRLWRERVLFGFFTSVIVLNGPVLLLILHFRFLAENRTRVEEYYLLAYFCLAQLLGFGLGSMVEWTQGLLSILQKLLGGAARRRPDNAAGGSFLLDALPCVALIPLAANIGGNNFSNYYLAYDFSRGIFDSLPPGAVFYSSGDYTAFPALYLQAVEHRRPDILIAEPTGNPSSELIAYARELDPAVSALDSGALFDAVLGGKRPVFVAAKSSLAGKRPRRTTPWGLVYRVVDSQAEAPDGATVLEFPLLRNLTHPTALDDLGQSILFDYSLMQGEAAFLRGEDQVGEQSFRKAEEFAGDNSRAYNNLGSTCAERGRWVLAERYFRKALVLDPNYRTAERNLEQLLGRDDRGQSSNAETVPARNDAASVTSISRFTGPAETESPEKRVLRWKALVLAQPHNPVFFNNYGSALAEAGANQAARLAFEEAVRLDPSYALPHRNLARLFASAMRDEGQALVHRRMYWKLSAQGNRDSVTMDALP